MKAKIFAGRRKVLIIGILFAVTVTVVYAAISMLGMVTPMSKTGEEAEPKNRYSGLPDGVKFEIQRLLLDRNVRILRWIADTADKRIDLICYRITPESQEVHGKTINGWTINVTYDTELKRQAEEIGAEVMRWREEPEMQIAGEYISLSDKEVVLFVYNYTPENQRLHNKTIDGWKIYATKAMTPEEAEQKFGKKNKTV